MSIYNLLPDSGAEAPFANLFKYKGGSPALEIPAPTPPPAKPGGMEAQYKKRDALADARRRKGIKSTLLNDESGSRLGGTGNNQNNGRGAGTLLGGS